MAAESSLVQFFAGVRLLGRGLATYGRNPGLLALGLVPAVITAVLFFAAFLTLLVFVDDLAALITWFADDWPAAGRTALRVLAGAAILAVAVLLTVLLFTAVTLVIGDPFYEKISELVEDRFGGVPDAVELPALRSLRWSITDTLRIVGTSVAVGIPLFLVGFVPVVGQVVAVVLGAVAAGWFLALEFVGVAFQRRGLRLAARRAALRQHRATALGFGVSVFLCFLIPFVGAVIVMPAAVAGGTLLARRALGAPTTE